MMDGFPYEQDVNRSRRRLVLMQILDHLRANMDCANGRHGENIGGLPMDAMQQPARHRYSDYQLEAFSHHRHHQHGHHCRRRAQDAVRVTLEVRQAPDGSRRRKSSCPRAARIAEGRLPPTEEELAQPDDAGQRIISLVLMRRPRNGGGPKNNLRRRRNNEPRNQRVLDPLEIEARNNARPLRSNPPDNPNDQTLRPGQFFEPPPRRRVSHEERREMMDRVLERMRKININRTVVQQAQENTENAEPTANPTEETDPEEDSS